MSTNNRSGFRWNVNEVLSLQREFELLGMSINEIAEKHKRTPNAIMFKLDQEGFADYNTLYSDYHNLNSYVPNNEKSSCDLNLKSVVDEDDDSSYHDEEEDDEDEDEDEYDLTNRVDFLENSINEIKDILKNILKSSTSNSFF